MEYDIFPPFTAPSDDEAKIINAALSHPAVKRHLQHLAEVATRQHVINMIRHNSGEVSLTPHEISVSFAALTGQLTLIESLVSFKSPSAT